METKTKPYDFAAMTTHDLKKLAQARPDLMKPITAELDKRDNETQKLPA